MKNYEAEIARATAPETREVLGAIASVVNKDGLLNPNEGMELEHISNCHEGTVLYYNASGHQSLKNDAPPINPNSVFILGSAGKFISHIAALQCVDRGLITLDEPVYAHLPELESLPIISANTGPDAASKPYSLRQPTKKITLRHLLSHSSGIGSAEDALCAAWRDANPSADDAHIIAKMFTYPLLFEPGEDWNYGASIHWMQLLLGRLTKMTLPELVQKHVAAPLGITSWAFRPENHPELWARSLQAVERTDSGKLVTLDEGPANVGLISSVADLTTLMADLLGDVSKLLSPASLAEFFKPQFTAPGRAVDSIRDLKEPVSQFAGFPTDVPNPPVSYGFAGMYVEEELALSRLPAGTVTWDGYLSTTWAMNRERGLGMVFATQVLPVGDKKCVALAHSFFKDAWNSFG